MEFYVLTKQEISNLKLQAEELRLLAEKEIAAISDDVSANWDSDAGESYVRELTELKAEIIKTANLLDESADRLTSQNNKNTDILI